MLETKKIINNAAKNFDILVISLIFNKIIMTVQQNYFVLIQVLIQEYRRAN